VEEIDRLVAAGVDVNTQGKEGMTPLLYALWAKNETGFRRLLEQGANPNIDCMDGESVTHLAAAAANSSEWLRLVIKHKGDVDLVNPKGLTESSRRRTPLYYAIETRNAENLKLLLAAGANPNHQDAGGDTPAMDAGSRNFWEGVEILLEAGADWKLKDAYGNDLATMCFRRKPADDKDFERDLRARRNVIAFLRKKGVDLEAVKKRVMERDGRIMEE
jgi:ankyrin repeat protein